MKSKAEKPEFLKSKDIFLFGMLLNKILQQDSQITLQ
jgi:hypothetical protein